MLKQLLSYTVLFESEVGVNSRANAIMIIIIIIIKLIEVMMMMRMKDSGLNHEFQSCRNQHCLVQVTSCKSCLSEVIYLIEGI